MKKILLLIKPIHKKFLIFGIINTLFGYFTGITIYFLLFDLLGIIIIGIITNIISISFSFVVFKLFVFKTKNTNWIKEYFRGYIVYGIKAIISILMLWACIDILELNIFISQAIAILTTTIITYKGHKNFTFKV
jgi:putative flippase GtrA